MKYRMMWGIMIPMRYRILHILAFALGVEIKIGEVSYGKIERRITD